MLHRACLQPSFRSSAEPELEEKQMEHVTGFLLPENVDNITPGFQRHNNPSKCNQLFLSLTFSSPPPYNFIDNTRCTLSMSVILRCLQMLPNVQISYSETLQEILLCFMQHINRSCHFKWKHVAQAHCYIWESNILVLI